jgi:hypothetical protein
MDNLNLTNYASDGETDNVGKLTCKCFIGTASQVEKQINDFFYKDPIYIKTILQSESCGANGTTITITILYYNEGKPHFLGEYLTARTLANKIGDYIEKFWGIKISDIQQAIFKKEQEDISDKQP